MKIDPYNFELYHFKVGAFFETQCTFQCYVRRRTCSSRIGLFSHNLTHHWWAISLVAY